MRLLMQHSCIIIVPFLTPKPLSLNNENECNGSEIKHTP